MDEYSSFPNPAIQQEFHAEDHDYWAGSPHLKHEALRRRLMAGIVEAICDIERSNLPLTVLEVGAGDGTFTEQVLGSGCRVWSTEMSRPSLDALNARFRDDARFTGVLDPDGSLAVLGEQRFSLILCISVLHHIPDYVSFIDKAISGHLSLGGFLIVMQEPLWYPSLGRIRLAFSKFAYLAWRATQGNYAQGLATRWRRLRGVYDESKVEDMAEYHIVRNGIDHERLMTALRDRFEEITFVSYWSSHGAVWQRIGEMLGTNNTFALTARGLKVSPLD